MRKATLVILVLVSLIVSNTFGQQKTIIKGKVTDVATKAPIAGVSIKVVNGNEGTQSAADGSYQITISKSPAELQFTSIGYDKLVKSIPAQSEILLNVEMSSAEGQELNGVVVTALGIKRETKALTYNVQEIKGDEVSKVKDANFVNSLQGKVAGVTINTSATGIGGGVRVVARGVKSLFGNNNALFVVDGVPLLNPQGTQATGRFSGSGGTGDGISNINPDDIENMTVLTGPAAAALYGSDAANGAVIITTKKGSEGKLKVELYNTSNMYKAFITPKLQTTYGSSADGAFDSWGAKLSTPSNYDPKKDFFQTGHNIITGINLSSGTKNNQTYFSASMTDGKGIIPNNTLKRYNFTLRNSATHLDGKLNTDFDIMYVNTEEQNMLAQGEYNNPLLPIYLMPRGANFNEIRNFENFDPTRNFNIQYWPYGTQGLSLENPYWQTYRELFNNYKNRYILGASAKYQINDWINITSRVKFDKTALSSENKYYASTITLFTSPSGSFNRSMSYNQQLYADFLANINKDFSKDFNFNANVGAIYQNNLNYGVGYGGYLGLVPNSFTAGNIIKLQANGSILGSYKNPLVRQAVLANTEFSYKKLLYLNISGRNEWNSTLANTSTEKSGFFYPSVGLSFVASDIKGFNKKTISFLKVRTALTGVGNALTQFTTTPIYDFNGTSPSTVTYKILGEIKPEKTRSLELGINSKYFDNKLSFDLTVYRSNTYNQLFSAAPPSGVASFTKYYLNAGNIQNQGIEALVGYSMNKEDFRWNSSLTFTLNRSKVIELQPTVYDEDLKQEIKGVDQLISLDGDSYSILTKKGRQIGEVYTTFLEKDAQGNYVLDNDGNVRRGDGLKYAGNLNPKFILGFRNEFGYKNLNFGFVLDGRFGGIVISQTQAILDRYGASEKTAQQRDQGGVAINGKLIDTKNYYNVVGNGNGGIGSEYVYSATNVRLRELYLNYNIPGKVFNNKIGGLSIGITGRNLLMLYNKAPFDPELTSTTGTFGTGVDYFMQPSLRNYGLSIKVNL